MSEVSDYLNWVIIWKHPSLRNRNVRHMNGCRLKRTEVIVDVSLPIHEAHLTDHATLLGTTKWDHQYFYHHHHYHHLADITM